MESTENKKAQKSNTLIYRSIAALLLAGGFTVAQTYVNGETEKELNELIAGKSDRISYESASRNMLTGSTRINDLKLSSSGKIVKIDTIIINNIGKKTGIPDHADVELKGIHFKASDLLSRRNVRKSQNLGYPDEMTSYAAMHYEYSKEDRVLSLKKFELGINDAFSISLGIELSNIDFVDKDDLGKLLMRWPRIKLNSAYLTVTNDVVMKRVFEEMVGNTNRTVAEIKEKEIAGINQKFGANPSGYELSMRDSLVAFIQNESSMTIKTGLESPIRIGALAKVRDPKKVVNLLKLDFSEK